MIWLSLTNSIRQQYPNIYSDIELKRGALSKCGFCHLQTGGRRQDVKSGQHPLVLWISMKRSENLLKEKKEKEDKKEMQKCERGSISCI